MFGDTDQLRVDAHPPAVALEDRRHFPIVDSKARVAVQLRGIAAGFR
jgi:hypothetical protein